MRAHGHGAFPPCRFGASSALRVARRVAPSPRSGALRCGRFDAGKVDFKHKTLNFFRATRDFNNGSPWDDVRTSSTCYAREYEIPT